MNVYWTWPWVVAEWVGLFGTLPVYVQWFRLEQPSREFVYWVTILCTTKNTFCMYILYEFTKETEESEKERRLGSASQEDCKQPSL